MDESYPINKLVDIDLTGYRAGDNDPDCTTEIFDLHGRKVE